MKIEYTEEDFKNAIKNPFFDKLCKKYEVVVNNRDYALFKKIADSYGLEPERMMQTYLHRHAELLREDYPNE